MNPGEKKGLFIAVVVAAAFLGLAGSARAITAGQVDDFEDGTVNSWANGGQGGAIPPTNVATGGPAGANDNFLQITSDGSGPGQFLTVFNRAQWLGNYIAADVTAIEVDLRNQGPTDLNIRLAFKGGTGISAPGYISTNPFFVAAGNNSWQHAVFLIDSSSLTPLNGSSDFNTFFSSGIVEVRFLNGETDTSLNGDPIVAQLGIDNIRAVPEPASAVLTALGLLGVVRLRFRNR